MDVKREAEDRKLLMGTTPKGKEIYMVRRYNKTVRFLELGSGGILPEELSGGFSSIRIAQEAVNDYIAKLVKANEKKKPLKKAK